ncbi:MAG TPA: IclR family transcriptional regulator, partial [Ramlibacter sp.]|nr:IclR family transcriptional regulator [Ramlibacter sp.]
AANWRALEKEILAAIEDVHSNGFCAASWQPEVVALAAPVAVAGHPVYVLNVSVTGSGIREATERLSTPLLQLSSRLGDAVRAL